MKAQTILTHYVFFQYIFAADKIAFSGGVYANPFEFIWNVIINTRFEFDYYIIFGTAIFQFLIPFCGTIGTTLFLNKWKSLYRYTFPKSKNIRTFLYKKAFLYSTSIAFYSFLAFLLYYVIVLIISNGNINDSVTRSLFADIFGKNFYINHRYLHHFLEGFIRFYYIPMIYTLFGISVSIHSKAFKFSALAPVLYYFGMGILALAFYMLNESIYIHINPAVLMASGDFNKLSTPLILLINSLPLFVSIVLVEIKAKIDV